MVAVLLSLIANAASPHPVSSILESRRSLRGDDYAAARRYAELALETPGAHDQEAAWLVGLTYQYDGDPKRALTAFEEALTLQPLGAFTDRIAINIAEVHAELGEHRIARREIRRVQRGRDFDEDQQARLDLDRAMWRLAAVQPRPGSRLRKRALKRRTLALMDLLETLPDGLASWHQARAHTQLAVGWLDLADELGLADPEVIERRALLLHHARKQLDATVELGHDSYTLAQLHRLGLAFERLGDDVVTVWGRPDDLPSDERQKVENVWVKAHRYYDLAERHAARTARFEEARLYSDAADHVERKVDRL